VVSSMANMIDDSHRFRVVLNVNKPDPTVS